MANFKPMFKGKEKLVLNPSEKQGFEELSLEMSKGGSLYFVNCDYDPSIKPGQRGLFVGTKDKAKRLSGVLIGEKERIKLIQKELTKKHKIE